MEKHAMKKMFLEAFDDYSDAIFRFCMVKTRNKELSEDLTQEVFMRFWQSLRDGKEFTNTRAFLYTIAGNLVIDWYRKKKSDSLDARMESGYDPQERNEIDPEEGAQYQEALGALEALEEKDQEVMLLRYVEGLEPREIAEVMEVSANVVSVRINRATKRLQKQLRV